MQATLLRMSILVAACTALASCGIDSFATLVNDPIPKGSSVSGLEFLGPEDDTEESYLGVEMFYRIYASGTDAETDKGYVIAKQSATNAVPGSIIESYLASAGGLNYHKPVFRNTSTLQQQIRIPAIKKTDLVNNAYYVVVDFSSSGSEPTITINNNNALTDDDETYVLRRSAVDSGGAFLTFLDEPDVSTDFRSTSSDDNESEYYVQFFAASYGLDFNGSLNELYGDAVYIGTIVINF